MIKSCFVSQFYIVCLIAYNFLDLYLREAWRVIMKLIYFKALVTLLLFGIITNSGCSSTSSNKYHFKQNSLLIFVDLSRSFNNNKLDQDKVSRIATALIDKVHPLPAKKITYVPIPWSNRTPANIKENITTVNASVDDAALRGAVKSTISKFNLENLIEDNWNTSKTIEIGNLEQAINKAIKLNDGNSTCIFKSFEIIGQYVADNIKYATDVNGSQDKIEIIFISDMIEDCDSYSFRDIFAGINSDNLNSLSTMPVNKLVLNQANIVLIKDLVASTQQSNVKKWVADLQYLARFVNITIVTPGISINENSKNINRPNESDLWEFWRVVFNKLGFSSERDRFYYGTDYPTRLYEKDNSNWIIKEQRN